MEKQNLKKERKLWSRWWINKKKEGYGHTGHDLIL